MHWHAQTRHYVSVVSAFSSEHERNIVLTHAIANVGARELLAVHRVVKHIAGPQVRADLRPAGSKRNQSKHAKSISVKNISQKQYSHATNPTHAHLY